MMTREGEYQEVRRLLSYPKEQCPGPDAIYSQLLRTEQWMVNKLTGTGKPWAPGTATLTTVSGTAEYLLTPTAGQPNIGKPLVAYRERSEGEPIPIPMTDLTTRLNNPEYRFWIDPTLGQRTSIPGVSPYQLGFFRAADGLRVRVFPAPGDDAPVIKVLYVPGAIDPAGHEWTDTPMLPEWYGWRTLQAALFLLPQAEWEGRDMDAAETFRKNLRLSLEGQFTMHNEEFMAYIRNPQQEAVGEMGFWFDD